MPATHPSACLAISLSGPVVHRLVPLFQKYLDFSGQAIKRPAGTPLQPAPPSCALTCPAMPCPCPCPDNPPAVRSQNKLFIPHPGPQAAGPNSQRLPRGPEPAGDLHASPKESNPRRLACSRLICPPLFEPQTEVSLISQPYGRRPMQVSSGGETSRGRRRPQQRAMSEPMQAPVPRPPRAERTTTSCGECRRRKQKVKWHFLVICLNRVSKRKLCPKVGSGTTSTPPFLG